jgi:ketosteroid isomerase-like protein
MITAIESKNSTATTVVNDSLTNRDFRIASASIGAEAPIDILKSVFAVLNQENIFGAVDRFAADFTYNDHALDLEFADKGRLIEFFQKSRELFPDSVVELVSTFECGDHAVAEWKLTASQSVPFGAIRYRTPIVLSGSPIVRINNGKITHWSDYYDRLTSRRASLGAFFEEWIEY